MVEAAFHNCLTGRQISLFDVKVNLSFESIGIELDDTLNSVVSFGDTCDSVNMGLDDTVDSANFLDGVFDVDLEEVILAATESGLSATSLCEG